MYFRKGLGYIYTGVKDNDIQVTMGTSTSLVEKLVVVPQQVKGQFPNSPSYIYHIPQHFLIYFTLNISTDFDIGPGHIQFLYQLRHTFKNDLMRACTLHLTYTHVEARSEYDQRVQVQLRRVLVAVWSRSHLKPCLFNLHTGPGYSSSLPR